MKMNEQTRISEVTPEQKRRVAAARRKKRRKWRETQLNLLALVILVPLIILIAIYLIVFPRSTVSQTENRTLNKFPSFSISSYFAGDFTEGIADWYDDTVPFRDGMKKIASHINSLAGFATDDTITYVNVDLNLEAVEATGKDDSSESSDSSDAADISESTDETSEDTSETTEKKWGQSKDYTAEDAENEMVNGIMIVKLDDHWRALPIYGHCDSEAWVNLLNTFQNAVGDDVTVYSMACPVSSQYYLPANAQEYFNDQETDILALEDEFDDRIVNIDLVPVLADHTAEDIYLRTDHHWAPLGAYYAAQAFAEAADVPFEDISTMESVVYNDSYVGTMYTYTEDVRLQEDPDVFVSYYPSTEYSTYYYHCDFEPYYDEWYDDFFVPMDPAAAYLQFMGKDGIICRVVTEGVNNGRKLLVVKDSFGNAEIPFYFGSFDEIYVVDGRYLEANLINMTQDLGITDVLFTMSTQSIFGTIAGEIGNILTQAPDVHYSDAIPVKKTEESETV